jgi:hypothetical protein
MSFDVVPAFDKGTHYEIPDTQTKSGWTETDPEIHADKAKAANDTYSGEWKGMVRMIKKWNNENGKPVKPSFLLEVMALDLLRPPFGGNFPYEFMAFFASAADRINQEWPEPARLGPPVSDGMTPAEKGSARTQLLQASNQIRAAINLSNSGQGEESLKAYRKLFGNLFPLS